MVHDQKGAFKGHAFVAFDRREEAVRAMEDLDGAEIDDGGSRIRVVLKDTTEPKGTLWQNR